MLKHEYKVIEVKPGGFWGTKLEPADIEIQLNKLGEEGWELLNSLDTNEYQGGTKKLLFIFKRLREF